MNETHDALDKLQAVIDTLLGPDGCPWDKAQTPETLCDYIVEEAFELVDCIRSGDAEGAMEELGDVMFLLLFVAKLYQGREAFELKDSLASEIAKMIRRHPHVFDNLELENKEELLRNWERIKRGEDKNKDGGVFDSLPKGLPPLLKAYRIHSKAARVGFTWENDVDMLNSLHREWREFETAAAAGDPREMEMEFGDYILSLTEFGRRKGLKANACLDLANKKFLARFKRMEALAKDRGRDIGELALEDWNALWDEVKSEE